MADISTYLNLVPSANQKPKFLAVVTAWCQPFVDVINFFESMVTGNFQLATAVGANLDVIGSWVGIGRYVSILLNMWFSFDTANLGFDQGVWWVPPEPQSGITRLDDTTYRALITAKIAWNCWNGTTPSYYSMLSTLFSPCTVTLTDNANKTVSVTVTGSNPNQTLKALATEGLLPFVPLGISASFSFTS